MSSPYENFSAADEVGSWWSEVEGQWIPLPPADEFGPPPGGAGLQLRANEDGFPALAQLVLYSADVDGYLDAIGLNEGEEQVFPALAELIRYSDDVDGYLRALGISEEAIRGEAETQEADGTTGAEA